MTPAVPLTPEEFEGLVLHHGALVRSINELELQLHLLGEAGDDIRAAGCRRAASDLIARLRDILFVWDQKVLPLVEPVPARPAPASRRRETTRDHPGDDGER
jgi:hypothetical protein